MEIHSGYYNFFASLNHWTVMYLNNVFSINNDKINFKMFNFFLGLEVSKYHKISVYIYKRKLCKFSVILKNTEKIGGTNFKNFSVLAQFYWKYFSVSVFSVSVKKFQWRFQYFSHTQIPNKLKAIEDIDTVDEDVFYSCNSNRIC